MKQLNVVFTNAEFRKLVKAKRIHKYTNWHNFVLDKCSVGISVIKRMKGGMINGKNNKI